MKVAVPARAPLSVAPATGAPAVRSTVLRASIWMASVPAWAPPIGGTSGGGICWTQYGAPSLHLDGGEYSESRQNNPDAK